MHRIAAVMFVSLFPPHQGLSFAIGNARRQASRVKLESKSEAGNQAKRDMWCISYARGQRSGSTASLCSRALMLSILIRFILLPHKQSSGKLSSVGTCLQRGTCVCYCPSPSRREWGGLPGCARPQECIVLKAQSI